MPFCPNCGSYISPGTNVCSCGTTFGYGSEPEEEREPTEFERQEEEKRKRSNIYWKKAKQLMGTGKYLEAIEYIDKTIEISKSNFHIFDKAKAYYYAGMYEEALPLFKQSINSYQGIDNYVKYVWVGDTLINLNRFDKAIEAYEKAIDIINEEYERSVNFFKSERWEGYERIERACSSALRDRNERLSIVQDKLSYLDELKNESIEKKSVKSDGGDFDSQEEFLKNIGKKNLITITGTRFYGNPKFEKGMELLLKKEKDNEFDGDAIAVYLNDVKVGYVANNYRTGCYLTSMASDVQISDIVCAEYILYFAYRYHIAEITSKP